jgi:hypothetical protein
MPSTLARAIKILEERAEDDPALAETVAFLAKDARGPDDPFASPSDGVLAAARSVNERRLEQRRRTRVAGALDTAEVVALIHSIRDRKGVDRRRRRGNLLGWQVGGRTLHPAWQFNRHVGDTRPGLRRVLEALRQVTHDAQAADALMSASREDLGGRTLADLFVNEQIDTVVRLILSAGDQS